MPDLAVSQTNRSGISPSYAGSPSDDSDNLVTTESYDFNNDGAVIVHIKNGATAGEVAIETPNTVDGLAIPDRDVTISANTEYFIGPFPVEIYNNADRQVALTFTTPQTMELLALRMT